jgi:hypothetical protein
VSDEPKPPTVLVVNGQAYQRVETPEPWKTALALVTAGKVAEAHALIEREVPEDAEVPDTRNVMRVMIAFALWQGRGSPPDAP